MREGSLQELLNSAILYQTSKMFTALPCIVIRTYMDEQRVDVQPVVDQIDREGNYTHFPPILSVPLMFPSSSTSMFSFPVNTGDTVLCVFIQRSTDVFKSSDDGKPQPPNDLRKYDKRDAVAIPGLWPFKKAMNNPSKHNYSHSTEDTVVVHNLGSSSEVEIRLKPSGDLIINSPTKVEVNCVDAEINCDTSAVVNCTTSEVNASTMADITAPVINLVGEVLIDGNLAVSSGHTATFNGDVTMESGTLDVQSGSVMAGGKDIGSAHTHSGVQTGGGNTGGPN